MDAIEKIARICAEWHDRTDNDQPAEEWVVDMYRSLADNLLAAFPQLALEGREEWGVSGPWAGGPDICSYLFEAEQTSSPEEGTTPVRRMAYYEPWSEVQS